VTGISAYILQKMAESKRIYALVNLFPVKIRFFHGTGARFQVRLESRDVHLVPFSLNLFQYMLKSIFPQCG